jgi:hypothetical protein
MWVYMCKDVGVFVCGTRVSCIVIECIAQVMCRLYSWPDMVEKSSPLRIVTRIDLAVNQGIEPYQKDDLPRVIPSTSLLPSPVV